MGLPAMTWAEFLCGPLNPGDQGFAETLFPEIEAMTPADSLIGAELFDVTGRCSRWLADCLIAATALRVSAQMATANG